MLVLYTDTQIIKAASGIFCCRNHAPTIYPHKHFRKDYSLPDQFIAHLRRVHPSKPSILMNVEGFSEKVAVKAVDPLAKPPMPLYYTHSKMPMYNSKFFLFWDKVIAQGFARTIPWFTVNSQKSLDRLFALEFEG
jgi:hypothetical protein